MESARCWFSKLKSKDKLKSAKKKEATGNGKEGIKPPTSEEAPSNVTKQKVAAAKQYIENHYKKQMKDLEERKEREALDHGLAVSSLSRKPIAALDNSDEKLNYDLGTFYPQVAV